ncbi:MAG: NUDIX hydrolase [Acidimicrobiales bacterium]
MDRWTICHVNHVHWGALGGAGLLLRYGFSLSVEPQFLLQQRSRWVDEGGTWGIPGGAIRAGESPEETARRESEEEVGTLPAYRVRSITIQDCGGGWKFYIVLADVEEMFLAYCVHESDATGWFTRKEMQFLPLHPGFRAALDEGLIHDDNRRR